MAYAASRYITIIPEIDTPGHTNAALASYAELNCNGVAPPLYTGTDVGFSSLCVSKDVTYKFLDDVIGEIAALTPGAYIHIGGDEAQSTTDADYKTFVNKVQQIVPTTARPPSAGTRSARPPCCRHLGAVLGHHARPTPTRRRWPSRARTSSCRRPTWPTWT